MRTPLASLAAALLLAVPACSSDDGGGATATSPQASAAATGSVPAYATTGEVITALEAAGVPCEEPQDGMYEGVSQAQSCILGGKEDAIVLRFASPAEREEYLATKDPLASVVLGPDWAVQTVLAESAEQVGEALGGEVRLGS